MRWRDYEEAAQAITEAKCEEAKNQMVAAAFIGWQYGCGNGKSFHEYLRALGLKEKEPKMLPEHKKRMAEQAKRIAERIARMDKRK